MSDFFSELELELRAAVRRGPRPAWRTLRVANLAGIAAGALALLVAGAVAAVVLSGDPERSSPSRALTDTQTGVPAIDRFLERAGLSKPKYELEPGTPQAQLRAANPGGADWVMLAFEKSKGHARFCLLAAPDTEAGRPRGGIGCVNRNNLGATLDRGGSLVSVESVSANRVLVSGLTFADATRVEVRTDRDRQAATFSEVFTETRFSPRFAPRTADGSPRRDRVGLRAFVAIVSAEERSELPDLPPGEMRHTLTLRPRVRVVTTLSDGRKVVAYPTLGG